MKKFYLIGILISMLISNSSIAQLGDYGAMVDTLLTKPIESGFLWWQQPNSFIPGQCFQQYRIISGDSLNNAVLDKSWVDPQLSMNHYRYQQTYKSVLVEGAYAVEHFTASNKLIFTNAKFAIDLDMSVTPQMTESDAKQMLLDYLPNGWVMAWNDEGWEADIQNETGDPTATYEPTGELILALDNYTNLNFYIDGSRYRLAYMFDIHCISPYSNTTYFVDAHTGEVFKELSNMHHDGLATVQNDEGAGTRTIDTRYRGFPNYDHVLETNNGDTRIHTKKGSFGSWILRSEIDKADEPWTGFEINATTTHWYAEQSWYYFRDVFGRDGMDNDNEKLRVHVDWEVDGSGVNAFYERSAGVDNMVFYLFEGITVGNFCDAVGHEFAHGVVEHTSNLVNNAESGALNESFGDIFGVMIKRYALHGGTGSPDWTIGAESIGSRSLIAPKLAGLHAILVDGLCSYPLGQPDTYLGEFWQNTAMLSCDNRGVHGNSGVQNHWFYLLGAGGSGSNDNGDSYNITGIGVDNAALIAYWNMTNVLASSSQYSDSRAGAIAASILLFGDCSNQHHQTTNAWYAVGVGDESDCETVLSLEKETNMGSISIYPNPTENSFYVNWENNENFNVKIYDLKGQLLLSIKDINNNSSIYIQDFSSGVYILEVQNGNDIVRKRIIKN